ncbi:MAG TPA: PAS domain-containing sensor histidine kinase [Thermoanaerobaculia bacterium]
MLDHGPVLVRRTDREARCDYVNESWLRFTGRAFEDQIGRGWASCLHPDDLPEYLEHRASFGRAPIPIEYRLRRHDGVFRRVRDVTVPFFETGGEVGGYISMCFEVPEPEGSDDPTTFLRMMAHELRTPLSSMRIFVEVLRRSAARGVPSTPETFARMDAQISRMERLVDDLSRSTRLSELELSLENLELGDLVRRVVDLRWRVGDPVRVERRHVIEYSGADEARWVWADRMRLEQVFTNLLNNAVKYSPLGGTIRISLSSEDGMHRVSFEDPGIGIPPKEIPLLTRRFFRASNASRENYPGLGLGLAFASEIVERHGGTLTFRSELGKGTQATVRLPSAAFGLPSQTPDAR